MTIATELNTPVRLQSATDWAFHSAAYTNIYQDKNNAE
jgi:hypothetical protein